MPSQKKLPEPVRKLWQVARSLLSGKIDFEVDLVPLPQSRQPYKKILNWLLTETSVYVKPQKPWGMPTVLQVEPTNTCNLRCRICPVASGLHRPAGHMDFDLFKKIIDEMGQYLLVMMFWDWGEPLLNPRSFDMIKYAQKAGIRVVVSTNGHLLADPAKAARLVESGVDQIVFSVDGITQDTYQHYRAQGSLETVLSGIRQVVEQKRLQNAQGLTINFRFIVMRHNQHEIGQLRDLCRELRVDVLSLRRFVSVFNPEMDKTSTARDLTPEQTDYQMPPRMGQDGQLVRVERNPCRNLWNCPTIHWDGTVCSCFMDFSEMRPLGNLCENSFREIWFGRAYRDLRKQFKERWQDLSPCSVCSSGYVRGDVGRDTNASAEFFKY